jgi:universal stress protein A
MSKKITNILIPIDLTDDSIITIEKTIPIAQKNLARIIVLYVLEIQIASTDSNISLNGNLSIEGLEKESFNKLVQLKTKVKNTFQFEIQIELRKGLVNDSILYISKEKDIDLIVMGSHGKKLSDCIPGSTIQNMIKSAPCTILVVPIEHTSSKFTKILFPDFIANEILEKYKFLKNIVQPNDLMIEFQGDGIRQMKMEDIKNTVCLLDEKIEKFNSSDDLQLTINNLNNTLDHTKIKLITIHDDQHTGTFPVITIKRQPSDYTKILVFSILNTK